MIFKRDNYDATQKNKDINVFKSMLPIPNSDSKKILVLDLNTIPPDYEGVGTTLEIVEKYKEDFKLTDYIIIPVDYSRQNIKNGTKNAPHLL